MTKVDRVEAKVIRLKLAKPVQLASRLVLSRDWLIVRIGTSDGAEGWGFSYAGFDCGDVAERMVAALLVPIVLGEDPHRTTALWERLYRQCLVPGPAGIVMRCISALDIALWDRNAKAAGLPLYKYLGVARTAAVPTYVGSGYYKDSLDDGAAEIAELAHRGFNAIKVKVGRLSARNEARRVMGFRRAAGDEIELIADANGAWPNASTAAMHITALRDAQLSFIEDPLLSYDLTGYRQLRRAALLPVSTGEVYTSPYDFVRAVEADAIDIAQVDATACGGVTAFRKIASLCEMAGIPLETHWFPVLHAHLAMTTETCRRVEVFPDDEIVNFDKLTEHNANIGVRSVAPAEDPGHGVRVVWQ